MTKHQFHTGLDCLHDDQTWCEICDNGIMHCKVCGDSDRKGTEFLSDNCRGNPCSIQVDGWTPLNVLNRTDNMPGVQAISVPKSALQFHVSAKENADGREWFDSHPCKLRRTRSGDGDAISEPLGPSCKWFFSETGIGTAVGVRCGCGAEKNVTDYSQW